MKTIYHGIRGVCLAMLVIAALEHEAALSMRQQSTPHFAGLGRLGRDLARRASGDEQLMFIC
jgi:hypothetical protein